MTTLLACSLLASAIPSFADDTLPLASYTSSPPPPLIESVPGIYQITVGDPTGDASYWSEVVRVLNKAGPTDTILFRLHSPGGDVGGLTYVMNALQTTKANTIADIDGPSSSAAAMLACSAKYLILEPNSYLMYHAGSLTLEGTEKSSDLASFLKAHDRSFKILMQPCVDKHILTEKQVDNAIKGIDIYVFPADIGQ